MLGGGVPPPPKKMSEVEVPDAPRARRPGDRRQDAGATTLSGRDFSQRERHRVRDGKSSGCYAESQSKEKKTTVPRTTNNRWLALLLAMSALASLALFLIPAYVIQIGRAHAELQSLRHLVC